MQPEPKKNGYICDNIECDANYHTWEACAEDGWTHDWTGVYCDVHSRDEIARVRSAEMLLGMARRIIANNGNSPSPDDVDFFRLMAGHFGRWSSGL
jgi:hypothetical protein